MVESFIQVRKSGQVIIGVPAFPRKQMKIDEWQKADVVMGVDADGEMFLKVRRGA